MATIGATYHEHMARALPGQWGDTSKYNIDGACVLETADGLPILVGVGVKHGGVDSWGNKIIKPITGASDVAYGVAIRSHFQTVSKNGRMVYEDGSGINVMTEGRVWMLRDKDEKTAPTFGAAVKLDENGFVKNEGTINTAWTFTGDYTAFGDLQLVEVQVQ